MNRLTPIEQLNSNQRYKPIVSSPIMSTKYAGSRSVLSLDDHIPEYPSPHCKHGNSYPKPIYNKTHSSSGFGDSDQPSQHCPNFPTRAASFGSPIRVDAFTSYPTGCPQPPYYAPISSAQEQTFLRAVENTRYYSPSSHKGQGYVGAGNPSTSSAYLYAPRSPQFHGGPPVHGIPDNSDYYREDVSIL